MSSDAPTRNRHNPSDDLRSYHINFGQGEPGSRFSAASHDRGRGEELCAAFRDNLLPNSFEDDAYFNVKRLQRLKAA